MPGSAILITTCVCCFLGGLIAGVSGFGLGIIFQLCWSLADSLIGFPGSGEVKTANAILFFCSLPIYIGMSLFEYYSHGFQNIRKNLVVGYLPGSIIGITMGTFVISQVESIEIERVLGFFLVVLSLERGYFLWKQYQKDPNSSYANKPFEIDEIGPPIDDSVHGPPDLVLTKDSISCRWFIENRKIIFYATIASLTSGLLAGLFGIGGPPLMLLVSYLRLSKAEIRANSSAIFALDIPFVAISLLAFGILHAEDWSLYLCGFFLAFVGGFIGTLLYRLVHTVHVQVLLLILIFIASLSLLHIGDHSNFAWAMVSVYVLVGISSLSIFAWYYFTTRHRVKNPPTSGPIELVQVASQKENTETKDSTASRVEHVNEATSPTPTVSEIETPVQSSSVEALPDFQSHSPPQTLLDPGHVPSDTGSTD